MIRHSNSTSTKINKTKCTLRSGAIQPKNKKCEGVGGGKGRRGGGRERGEIPECERVKCKLEQFEDVRLYTMSFQLLFYSKT